MKNFDVIRKEDILKSAEFQETGHPNTFEDMEIDEKSYLAEDEFQKRYGGQSSQQILKKYVADISAFRCPYQLQARVWHEIKDADLPEKDLVRLLSVDPHHIILREASNKLAQPKYLDILPNYELAKASRYAADKNREALLDALLTRTEVESNALKYALDGLSLNTNTKKKLTIKLAECVVKKVEKKDHYLDDDVKVLISSARSCLRGEDQKENDFLNDLVADLQNVVKKYLLEEY